MEKLFRIFCGTLIGMVLVACGQQAVKPTTLTAETFNDIVLTNTDTNDYMQKIFFEDGKMIITFDFNKQNAKDERYISLVAPEVRPIKRDDSSMLISFYDKSVNGYDKQYGDMYAVYEHVEISEPKQNQTDWYVKATNPKDPSKIKHEFFFTPTDEVLKTQFGGTYTVSKK